MAVFLSHHLMLSEAWYIQQSIYAWISVHSDGFPFLCNLAPWNCISCRSHLLEDCLQRVQQIVHLQKHESGNSKTMWKGRYKLQLDYEIVEHYIKDVQGGKYITESSRNIMFNPRNSCVSRVIPLQMAWALTRIFHLILEGLIFIREV